MAETTTLPELGTIASDIKSRLVALESEIGSGAVTSAQLEQALASKLDAGATAVAAEKAARDGSGNNIVATYATKTELNTKQDKGDYVTVGTANTTYLKKADAQTTYLGISGKAASATSADSATKATKDGSGNVITDTYLTKTAAATTYLGISSKAASAASADTATRASQADSATTAMSATSATTAEKAVRDGNGNIISSTYATKAELSSAASNAVPISYGTNDLVAGESPLASGAFYFVYE